ncbi:hypothetical protein [Synechocystis sp. CACIAM 05]|uniref:hypothetical protein n=1 Tax=Synechocystis sp. CACIAM 05 TaxID=1933929 RepID=UPI001F26A2ED|nr:hypothetical protein [Synechocystis sp. CACIAM 05]
MSECFYPLLQSYEITLRNHFDHAIYCVYGEDWLVPTTKAHLFLCDKDREKIQKIIQSQGRDLRHNQILSSLTLGFWTALSYREYEHKQKLYPVLFKNKDFMPQLPRSLRTRAILSNTLGDINKFRNKIFHHEPICNNSKIKQQHDKILQVIGWMSPTIAEITGNLSRFDEVQKSRDEYLQMARELLKEEN